MRRGEHAGSMWFIDAGEVAVRTPQRRLTLGPGDYFGELALLEAGPRHTTIVTLTACRLLELRAGDFQRLIAGDPTLRERMLEEMRARYGVELEGSG
jgi:CRP-like cAMP-binding protein